MTLSKPSHHKVPHKSGNVRCNAHADVAGNNRRGGATNKRDGCKHTVGVVVRTGSNQHQDDDSEHHNEQCHEPVLCPQESESALGDGGVDFLRGARAKPKQVHMAQQVSKPKLTTAAKQQAASVPTTDLQLQSLFLVDVTWHGRLQQDAVIRLVVGLRLNVAHVTCWGA